MPNKNHKCSCDHASVQFCKCCNTVWCKDCNQEWLAKSTYTYTTPWYGAGIGGGNLGPSYLGDSGGFGGPSPCVSTTETPIKTIYNADCEHTR